MKKDTKIKIDKEFFEVILGKIKKTSEEVVELTRRTQNVENDINIIKVEQGIQKYAKEQAEHEKSTQEKTSFNINITFANEDPLQNTKLGMMFQNEVESLILKYKVKKLSVNFG